MIAYKLHEWININHINWMILSSNSTAIDLLAANQDKIHWIYLSGNPNAIDLLTANQDKINGLWLSRNPNAIDLLTANQDKLDWIRLSSNPAIFTYDYDHMRETKKDLHEALMQELFHPHRIAKYLEDHDDVDGYLP